MHLKPRLSISCALSQNYQFEKYEEKYIHHEVNCLKNSQIPLTSGVARGGGQLPPWQKLCPPFPQWNYTFTEIYGEPRFWVPVSPPCSPLSRPCRPLILKVWLRPCHWHFRRSSGSWVIDKYVQSIVFDQLCTAKPMQFWVSCSLWLKVLHCKKWRTHGTLKKTHAEHIIFMCSNVTDIKHVLNVF